MPRPSNFSANELADMILAYGEAGQSGRQALEIYRERFPNRRTRDSWHDVYVGALIVMCDAYIACWIN